MVAEENLVCPSDACLAAVADWGEAAALCFEAVSSDVPANANRQEQQGVEHQHHQSSVQVEEVAEAELGTSSVEAVAVVAFEASSSEAPGCPVVAVEAACTAERTVAWANHVAAAEGTFASAADGVSPVIECESAANA